ncbi:SDR family oxidoreductase [Actinomadura sp. KC216]|uniref:SDR family oxidoreductase n=1 Tax=Actinomadura sp. KC216 TaxID=2530370 RepID=UPI001049CA80|nr:SDR family oxidoreductase [Actinomadura sp. KC216]TDB91176.1 SDR family oxidoreductase [Actinomadura sp. KC216]
MTVSYDFSGQTALVTGAGHGMGALIAARLASGRAHVILNYCRDSERAEATLQQIIADGGSAELVRANVADHEAVVAMFDRVRERHERLHILVNNAASGAMAPFTSLTEKHLMRAVTTNYLGPLWCASEAVRSMPPGAAIVNISATGANFVLPGYAGVGPSKAALEALTRYLAAEFGPKGIRVNAASAGPLDSEAAERFPDAARLRSALESVTPLRRLGTPAELANVAIFLASSEASWISGQTVIADGGFLAAPLGPEASPR